MVFRSDSIGREVVKGEEEEEEAEEEYMHRNT